MQRNCARCERKVKAEENWLHAHLWASNAVFHWACFIALKKEHGEQGAGTDGMEGQPRPD